MGDWRITKVDQSVGGKDPDCDQIGVLLFISAAQAWKGIWFTENFGRLRCKYWIKKWQCIRWYSQKTVDAKSLLSYDAWESDLFLYLYQ